MRSATGKKSKKTLKAGPRPITILIVEDDQDLRESLVAALGDEGYQVLSARDADAAIQCARKHKVAVVFVDICLPDRNGVETYIVIKKIQPTAKTVMMTGFFVPDLVNEAIRAGACDILYKPFTMDDILNMIRKITG